VSQVTIYAPGVSVEVKVNPRTWSSFDYFRAHRPVIADAKAIFENLLSRLTKPTPSFYGDWESGTVTGLGSRNWKAVQRVAVDRLAIVADGGARQGTKYARVQVLPGDDPLALGKGTERAEVYYMQDASNAVIFENQSSGTQQYSFSVKFDPSWQTIVDYGATTGKWTGAWGIFLQLHGPDNLNTNAAWAITAAGGGHGEADRIHLLTRFGDITLASGPTTCELSNGALNIGHWIDFILTVKYAKDSTGSLTLQRRDEGDTAYTQVLSLPNTPTLQYSPAVNGGAVGDHYIKHGLYRNGQPFTSVLYLDGFTRMAA
jgi:polysaccharide lyase-like protein